MTSKPNGVPAIRFEAQVRDLPADAGGRLASRKVRCRFAQGSDSGPGFTSEISCLLRTRLRLAVLVILAAFAFHLLSAVVLEGRSILQNRSWLLHIGCDLGLMAWMVIVWALLSSRRELSIRGLRFLELSIFGGLIVFFAWLQAYTYHDDVLLRAIMPGGERTVMRLAGAAASLRWFMLIVIYGTFIPNTWKRCAAVVGVMALTPIVVNLVESFIGSDSGAIALVSLADTIKMMGLAVAIAVFGTHKIRQLYEQAHEAQQIGQYRLKDVLGFGGMGTVYLAEHVMLRRPCAIKLIRPDQAGDPKTLLRFEREVQATATLTHWNTVEIFDYGHTEDGTFYYVMEYLPGMNLEDLVDQNGPMPPERALHLIRQVCQALREAHSIGLIHRDIKPSNIFACERGKVHDVAKLLDFGLVKSMGQGENGVKLTREGVFAGSPAFMSPEQATGRDELDARSDIYNVGAVAYFLITGELLFDRESPLQMLHAHAYEALVPNPDFLADVPADLQRVILRCLEKDPERRYQDAATLDAALAACECAGRWTMVQAEDWWKQHAERAPTATLPEAVQRESPTQPAIR